VFIEYLQKAAASLETFRWASSPHVATGASGQHVTSSFAAENASAQGESAELRIRKAGSDLP
jgi:hypothetical protein